MTTVFLSGSRHVRRLPKEVVERIDSMIESGLDIVVGDANGADRLMQAYLDQRAYRKVRVFHAGETYRNNLGEWTLVQVDVEEGVAGREFYTRKDRRMADVADFGFIVWDGKSSGSVANATELARQGKKSVVFVVPRKNFVVVREARDLLALQAAVPPNTTVAEEKSSTKSHRQRSFGF